MGDEKGLGRKSFAMLVLMENYGFRHAGYITGHRHNHLGERVVPSWSFASRSIRKTLSGIEVNKLISPSFTKVKIKGLKLVRLEFPVE